jgi:MFS superfamily sulfate permease-like transporter
MFPEPPLKRNLSADLRSSLVVFLVALPLCLGIALASGAPAFAGIIAGIIGGIVVGLLSGSRISVSGPAAGLTVVVLDSIKSLGAYEAFLLAVFLSGIIQVVLGLLKAGKMTNYFPSAVIKGMLASIGLILIFKQLPHALGYDFDYSGDESFFESDGHNTFTDIYFAFLEPAALAIVISISSLLLMILWDTYAGRFSRFGKLVPGALLAVVSGTTINLIALSNFPELALTQEHLVALPTDLLKGGFSEMMKLPDFSQILNPKVYQVAFTIAVIASIESLLSIEASDKLDPDHQITPTNKELIAQGSGNILSGLLGGIPVTAVIVRSSANINAGGKTKVSAIVHGVLLLISVLAFPQWLNKIPIAALACILLFVGYKLAKVSLFRDMYKLGWEQFIPFIITMVGVVMTDLLKGIAMGMGIAVFYILKKNLKNSYSIKKKMENEEAVYKIKLSEEMTFLNKGSILNTLHHIKENSKIIIDGSFSKNIDYDVSEAIFEFKNHTAKLKNITVELIDVPEVEKVGGH